MVSMMDGNDLGNCTATGDGRIGMTSQSVAPLKGAIGVSLELAGDATDRYCHFAEDAQRQLAVLLWRGCSHCTQDEERSAAEGLARQVADATCEHALALIDIATRLALTRYQEGLHGLRLLEPLRHRKR